MPGQRDSVVQLSLVQLDDYGPWTVTPKPRPEAGLQALQSRLYADRGHALDIELLVRCAVLDLADRMRDHGGVTSFVGGDNAISVCPPLPTSIYGDVLDRLREASGVEMRVGVSTGETARDAGMRAKHALERGRATGERVAEAERASADD